jgi:hypothetical protein
MHGSHDNYNKPPSCPASFPTSSNVVTTTQIGGSGLGREREIGRERERERAGERDNESVPEPQSVFLEVNTIGVSGMFGEVAVLTKGLRSASVVSLEQGLLMRVSKLDWWRCVNKETREYLLHNLVKYPDAAQLRTMWREGRKWESYRHSVEHGGEIGAFPGFQGSNHMLGT